MSYHWTDRSKKAVAARESLRTHPPRPCKTQGCLGGNEAGTHKEDAEKWPEEFFKCPWAAVLHITWGGILPRLFRSRPT